MRQTPFNTQFNRLQWMLFVIIVLAALSVSPPTMAEDFLSSDGKEVRLRVTHGQSVIPGLLLGLSATKMGKAADRAESPAFTPREYEDYMALAEAAAGSLRLNAEELRIEPGPRTFFQWVDRYGTLNFTDDLKRIPALYTPAGGVIYYERKFTDVDAKMAVADQAKKPRIRKPPVPERVGDECQWQPTHVSKEWSRVRGPENHMYRRLVTTVIEGCGAVTYRGTASPSVQLGR